MSSTMPSEVAARRAAEEALGWRDMTLSRFTTGLCFYVYDVVSPQGRAVIRMGTAEQAGILADGVALSKRLRPLGVPLPELLSDGTEAQLPFVVLERLDGTDLNHVIAGLSRAQQTAIAHDIAAAQQAVARLGNANRYGYAAAPDRAVHTTWSDVLGASIDRAERRIRANGLFDPALPDLLTQKLEQRRASFDQIAATPFLHDTTVKNVIISEHGTLSGICDVDDLCFGDPRYPIGLTRTALLTKSLPTHYTDAWLGQSGHADDGSVQFYTALFLLDFMAEHGTAFNGNMAPSRTEDRAALERHFHDALRSMA